MENNSKLCKTSLITQEKHMVKLMKFYKFTTCIFITILSLSVSYAGETIADKYGIAITKINSPEYLTEIKEKISSSQQYSFNLSKLLERHYELLLNGEESPNAYISFYKENVKKSSNLNLKNVFYQRIIRGLFRKKSPKEEIEEKIKKLDLTIIKANKIEFILT